METRSRAAIGAIYIGSDDATAPSELEVGDVIIPITVSRAYPATAGKIDLASAQTIAYNAIEPGSLTIQFPTVENSDDADTSPEDGDEEEPAEGGEIEGENDDNTGSEESNTPSDTTNPADEENAGESNANKAEIRGRTIYTIFASDDEEKPFELQSDNLVNKKDHVGLRWILESSLVTYTPNIIVVKEQPDEPEEDEGNQEENDSTEDGEGISAEGSEESGTGEDNENQEEEISPETTLEFVSNGFTEIPTEDYETIILELIPENGGTPIRFSIDIPELDNNKNITIHTSRDRFRRYVHRSFIHPKDE